jgi:aromatic-L-amino-acid decarboxylase
MIVAHSEVRLMDKKEFRRRAHEVADWMADYIEEVERYPVKSRVEPGEVLSKLGKSAPLEGEGFEAIMSDLDDVIMPGITHWQHPSFFGYFPANTSPPSVLAEMIVSVLGVQCMMWQTSPAATELEERVMDWLRDMLGLPSALTGVIQDTASTATLCAILSAREQATDLGANERGVRQQPGGALTAYTSVEGHSSVEKGVKIAGLGAKSLRKIPVDDDLAMIPAKLEEAIERDRRDGFLPTIVVATMGTTGSTAIDPLGEIGEICKRHGVWLHVDGAYAGNALVLPSHRWMAEGIEHADSFVMNPHKWMMCNLPCSAHFVRNPGALTRALEILPEYLKTKEQDEVRNYRDWGIQLGRRFNALKLWFTIRSYGVEGIRAIISRHMEMGRWLADRIEAASDFELLAPVVLNLCCFRYRPEGSDGADAGLDALNERLLHRLNETGELFLSHTRLKGRYALRLVAGQTFCEPRHVEAGWDLIKKTAQNLSS